MTSSSQLRQSFLDFFRTHDHKTLPSSSLIPHQDPSLLFTTAGMVQFKDVFTGIQSPDFPRVATCQKSLRAGGKHNDLDQVGYTARHHTFFEMLGNFSFGDYFKEKAIFYAWKLLTQEWGIPCHKLWITVYHDDDEAYGLWKKIANLDDARIIRIHTLDNFWSAGDTGPCGPCSEIFYDHGPHLKGGLPGTPDADGDRFVELWNLVFMQFDATSPTERALLPKPSIDTGMGLERIACVMQGVSDNYDTDIFKRIIAESEVYACSKHPFSHRVIADHLRSSAFLIADGVLPSSEGRGYVLRRIMRRAMRHIHFLGAGVDHMHKLLPLLIELMGQDYNELVRAKEMIGSVMLGESERFHAVIDKGCAILEQWMKHDDAFINGKFSGEKAFQLHDTYGFPLDLTEDILREKGFSLDHDAFTRCMEQQQARSQWVGSGDVGKNLLWTRLSQQISPSIFTGYEETTQESTVIALAEGDSCYDTLISSSTEICLVTSQTPFYGESGGQWGDTGTIKGPHGVMQVTNTTLQEEFTVHHGIITGKFSVGDRVTLEIDRERRNQIAAHHSATHLLHAALKRVLGEHVHQKGSLVKDNGLRFDFSHHAPLSQQEIQAVEYDVNQAIQDNIIGTVSIVPYQDALKSGATALFGEKYKDNVRVMSFEGASRELCGGTHVDSTGRIGCFFIVEESAVASGVRRIHAVAAQAAITHVQTIHSVLRTACRQLNTTVGDMPQKITHMVEEKKHKTTHTVTLQEEKRTAYHLFYAFCSDGVVADMKKQVISCMEQKAERVVIMVAAHEQKITVVVGTSHTCVDARELMRMLIGTAGSGGGKRTLAQGGFTGSWSSNVENSMKSLVVEYCDSVCRQEVYM